MNIAALIDGLDDTDRVPLDSLAECFGGDAVQVFWMLTTHGIVVDHDDWTVSAGDLRMPLGVATRDHVKGDVIEMRPLTPVEQAEWILRQADAAL